MSLSSCDIGNPIYRNTPSPEAGEGSFIAQIFCVNQDGGEFGIQRDVEYTWQEVPGGIEVWAKVYETFCEFTCGKPDDLKQQIWDEIQERHSDHITNVNLI